MQATSYRRRIVGLMNWLRALERDWAAWAGEPSDDLMQRSQFNLFYDIGVHFFGRNSGQAMDYANGQLRLLAL